MTFDHILDPGDLRIQDDIQKGITNHLFGNLMRGHALSMEAMQVAAVEGMLVQIEVVNKVVKEEVNEDVKEEVDEDEYSFELNSSESQMNHE